MVRQIVGVGGGSWQAWCHSGGGKTRGRVGQERPNFVTGKVGNVALLGRIRPKSLPLWPLWRGGRGRQRQPSGPSADPAECDGAVGLVDVHAHVEERGG